MRILMLTDFYAPIIGGLELHVRNLSLELVRRGHSVAVITLWHAGLAEEECDQGVQIFRVRGAAQRVAGLFSSAGRRFAPPLADPEVALAIQRIVARLRPQVVHAHNWLVYSFLPLKRASGAPLLMTLHDYGLACPKKTLMRGDAICAGPALGQCFGCAIQHYGVAKGAPTAVAHALTANRARAAVDMYIAVSQAVVDGNRLAAGPTPYRIIPNFVPDTIGTDLGAPAPELAQLPAEDFLLFVGALGRHKGVEVLLQAYDGLRDAPPLVLIGPSDPETTLAPQRGVQLLGSWPHSAVMQARRRSIAALVPSIWPDPCPTVALEAMAAGQPVIGSRIGGLTDLVSDGETGLLVPPGDAAALRQAIELLIANPELRARMAQAAAHQVTRYQTSAVVTQIEQLYRDMCAVQRGGAPAQRTIGAAQVGAE